MLLLGDLLGDNGNGSGYAPQIEVWPSLSFVDTSKPVITIIGDTPMTIEVGSTFTDPGATATDNYDGNVTVTSAGTVDANTVGTYTLTYTATDSSNNTLSDTRTVNVVDTTPPNLLLNGDTPMTIELGSTFTDPGATATDNYDDNVTVTTAGTVDANTVGTYTLTYTATDSNDNTASDTRTVNVIDSSVPTIIITSSTNGVIDGSITNHSTIELTFTTSKSTSNFTESDITLGNGSLSSFNGSGKTYTAIFTPDESGACTIDVAANTFTGPQLKNNTAATQFNWTYDNVIPTVTNVTSNKEDGSYKQGDEIPITITFSEVVNVTGIPQLSLETGNSNALVNYSSGTGTDTLTFNYSVEAGHTSTDLDYVATNSLTLNSGTIKDIATNDAILTLANPGATNSLGSNKALIIYNTPVANIQSVTVDEQTAVSITLVGTDADGDNLTYSIIDTPINGTANLDGDKVTYISTSNSATSDSFSFKVNDGKEDSAKATVSITITAINDIPVAVEQNLTVHKKNSITITLNGTDPDGTKPSIYKIISLTSNGTLNDNGVVLTSDDLPKTINSADVFYTSTSNSATSDSFLFKVNDGDDDSAEATVTLSITNYAPVAVDDTLTINEDAALTSTDVIANDTDLDDDTLSLTAATTDGAGTVAVNADGLSVDYTPTANFNGTETITYTVSDGTDTDATGTLTITVTAVNDAPVAVTDTKTVAEDAALTSTDVIANDTDLDDDTLSLTAATTDGAGTVAVNADGLSVDYTPTANFNGTETITYTVSDGTDTDATGTLTITVTAVNDAPVAVTDTKTVAEDAALTSTDVIANDTDLDDDTLSLTAATTDGAGTVAVNADGLSVDYTPTANFNGTETITYTVSDGTDTDATGTLTITVTAVNDAPVATPQSVTTIEDKTLEIILSGSDPDEDTLTYALVDNPSNGTVSVEGNKVTYTPNSNYNGTDTFTYKANDGSVDSNVSTVTITVTNQNDAPTASDVNVSVDEDNPVDITLVGSDVDGDDLTYSLVSDPSNGTVSVEGNKATYTPNSNYNGTDTFTYKANDGELDSNLGTVTVTVNAVNDTPTASDVNVSTSDNTSKTITLLGSDVDNDNLEYLIVNSPTSGTVSVSGDTATYISNSNYNGTDTFTYKVNDGSVDSNVSTVTITVTNQNDAPTVSDVNVSVDEDNSVDITLVGSDVDGDDLTYSLVSDPSNGTVSVEGNKVTYISNSNYNGTDTFTYKANDGELDSNLGTVTVTVNAVNDTPTASDVNVSVDEDNPVDITLVGSDVDGDDLTYSLVSDPSNGTVSVSGDTATYTPNSNYNGTDTFTYKANDGSVDSNVSTVTITVTNQNDAPTASDVNVSVDEDNPVDITLVGSDVDGDDLTYSLVSDPSNGTVSVEGNKATYTPNSNYNGTDTFTYKANDGSVDSNVSTVTITVTNQNDAPTASDVNVSVDEDNPVDITLVGSDVDGDDLTYSLVSDPSNGTVSVEGNKATYTPNSNYNGTDTFTYKANDGSVDSNVSTVTITVTNQNDAPTVSDVNVSVDEDNSVDITLVGSDVDGDDLTYSLVSDPSNGTVSVSGDTATYISNSNYNGTDTFTYKANDGSVDSNVSTVTITVTNQNDAPTASDVNVSVDEDNPVDITLVGSDVDGDDLTYSLVSDPSNGTVSVEGNKATYTPNSNYNGTDTFTYKANDGSVDSNVSTVTITVTNQNDAPTASDVNVSVDEDNPVDITLVGSDVDGDDLTYSLVSDPTNGTVSLTESKVTYVPSAGYFGSDSFTFKVNDGTIDSEKGTVSITVTSNDLDEDGVLNNVDKCPNTPAGSVVDVNGCKIFSLPQKNNKVEVTSATCIGNTDGSIGLSVENASYDYTITVTGRDPITITGDNKTASVTGLGTGTYTICFKVDGQAGYEQCFEVVIGEPKALSAFIDIDNDKRTSNIQLSGSNVYNIDINGQRHLVKGDNFTTTLPTGLSIIKISTNLDCQGVIEKEVFISEDIMYYPNPTQNDVKVHVSGEDTRVKVSVFSEKGDLIYTQRQEIQDFSRKTRIDLSRQITGIYIVVMEGSTVRKTFKIVKR